MRNIQHLLFTASAVLGLVGSVQAATIHLGNYILQPNLAGQTIVINVTDIVPNAGDTAAPGNVNGMVLNVAIDDGGPAYGGSLGPRITSFDVDSGPSIWVAPQSPAGHNAPVVYIDPGGQLAQVNFLTVSGFVNVTGGVLATLTIDTTGVHDLHKLTLSGGAVEEFYGNTELSGSSTENPTTFIYDYYNGTGGQLGALDDPWPPEPPGPPYTPEPSTFVLAALGLIGLVVWRRRKR